MLIGVGAAIIVLAATVYAGAAWLQYRVERDIAASFAAMRTTAGHPATYGEARFDPWTRTIRISDVVVPMNPDATSLAKVAEVVLVGVPLFAKSDRITARRADMSKIDVAVDAVTAVRIDGLTIDDLDVSRRIDWQRLRVAAEAAGKPPGAAAQAKDVLPEAAETLEGIRFGRLEMRAVHGGNGPKNVDIGSIRLDGFAGGRLAELTLRDTKSLSPQDNVSFGRLTFKNVDLAGLLRKSAQLSAADRPATPEEIGALAAVLEGVEMDDVVVSAARPDRASGTMVHLLSLRASWGELVGTVPTAAHYAAKAEMPIADQTGDLFKALRDAGFHSLTFAFDIGSKWTEGARTFVLSPVALEFDNLFSASLALSLGNFSPDLLTNDQAKTAPAAAALEAGPIELSLHDGGALDFLVAQVATKQGLSVSAARAKMIEDMNRVVQAQPQPSPEFARLVDALGRFLASNGQTLKIILTPKGQVNLLQTLQSAKTDPMGALSRFSVEASVSGP